MVEWRYDRLFIARLDIKLLLWFFGGLLYAKLHKKIC